MQLPRGRFHRLLKSTTPRALIEEMGSEQFTGICTIVLGSQRVTLVLNEGLVVLAEYGDIKGQHVLDAVLKGEEDEAAAELNLLTPDQVQLALEFNRPFATGELDAGRQGRPSSGKAASGGTKKAGGASLPKHRPEPTAEVHRIPMPGVKPVQKTPPASQSESDEVDTLVQNMEEMDVEQLVSSFRVNCKDMLRRIHLDHLIQDKDT
ncbi:hypothetical protein [Methanoculleus oceani]|uniref:DUF4388 domain-containing protein n=1 Tax=Methanoculleus oceani TaxID=2184756 RepID=A0ABD4TGQ6_9EURY|nr:hypothetical protein [Methanoculleus sp. CWC-02]MCM2466762.1 hypothetical protein [Methanoculleus sp. CWC-02]